jgi:dTMP kinase
MFITFEGLDFSGKSTQAKLLVQRLEQSKLRHIFLREPGGTAISEKIRDLLLDTANDTISPWAELFLFSAARIQLVTEVIQPALDADTVVVCDRFYDSTTAYQGYGRGLSLEDIASVNAIATQGTTPDLTLFIQVDREEILRRKKASGASLDRMESAGQMFYDRVRDGYLALAAKFPHRFIVVDGMQSVDAIHNTIWELFNSRRRVAG